MNKNKLLSKAWVDMDESEQRRYLAIYGDRFIQREPELSELPYCNKFGDHTTLAVYGAGRMGRAYVQRLQEAGHAKVALWVDNRWDLYRSEGYDVSPVDTLLSCYYDYVLIAVLDTQAILEIKHNLMELGIPESKIIAGCREEPDWLKQDRDDSSVSAGRFFLMNTPEHRNLGDHALAIAASEFLKEYFPDRDLIEVTGVQWDLYKDEVKSMVSADDIIFYAGGGFMGDLWSAEDGRVKEMIEAFPDNRGIFLPQTFYYNIQDGGHTILESDREFYAEHKNLLVLHREYRSYEFFKTQVLADDGRNGVYPDMVLYLGNMMCQSERNGVLFCFRTDKEKLADGRIDEIYELCMDRKMKTEGIDTLLPGCVSHRRRAKELDAILQKIGGCRLLITDRLHGMLFAAVTGTPCIALDNVSRKVSGVYHWIEKLPYVICVGDERVTEELIERFYAMENCAYDRSLVASHYADMARVIGRWIEE